jgi:holin-like protein
MGSETLPLRPYAARHWYKDLIFPIRHFVHRSRSAQIFLLIGLWFAGQTISRVTHLPIPGGILGLLIVLGLLYTGAVRVRSLALGAEWFLTEMLLFFIPAVPAILNHHELLGWMGIKVLLVIAAGTVVVMIATAFVVDFCIHAIDGMPRASAQKAERP